MTKQKLCILIDWYLPGTKAGGPVRSINALIENLKNKFNIYLITTNVDLGATIPYESIEANKWFLKEEVNYFYFSTSNLNTTTLRNTLHSLNPEIIYINSFWSYLFSIYVIQLKNKQQLGGKIVLAPRGMLDKGARKIKSFKKTLYLSVSRLSNFYKNVHFHATNDLERDTILALFPKQKVNVVPNLSGSFPKNTPKTKTKNELSAFYLSRISPIKNLHFALEVLKEIPEEQKITYVIYGNIEDSAYWNQCQQIIHRLPENIKVSYMGEIPFHQIQETITQHHLLFLPTGNENFGHSIVESLMSGCSALISNQTPWIDLEAANAGYSLPLNSKDAFVTTLINYAKMNQMEYNKVSEASITYITKKIDLHLTKDKYIQLFNDAS